MQACGAPYRAAADALDLSTLACLARAGVPWGHVADAVAAAGAVGDPPPRVHDTSNRSLWEHVALLSYGRTAVLDCLVGLGCPADGSTWAALGAAARRRGDAALEAWVNAQLGQCAVAGRR